MGGLQRDKWGPYSGLYRNIGVILRYIFPGKPRKDPMPLQLQMYNGNLKKHRLLL